MLCAWIETIYFLFEIHALKGLLKVIGIQEKILWELRVILRVEAL